MIHAWGITDKGAVRTQNQDGFYLDVPSEHLAVGVVCDGMGGAKAGNIASLIRRSFAGRGDRQYGSLSPGRH